MKVAVNTRFLIGDKLEGIGRFSYEILRRLTQNHPEVEFYFLFDRQPDSRFIFSKNVKSVVLYPSARHPFLWYWWFEWSVKNAIKKIKPDLFFSPDGYTSLSAECKKLTVFHDLAFEHYPQDVSFLVRWYYKKFTPLYAQNSHKIIAVSEFTKQDISHLYKINPSKIDVVHNASAEYFKPSEGSLNLPKINNETEYFLYVGALQPRKNLINLFKAFEKFKKENVCNTKLVIVGRKAWKYLEIEQTYENLSCKKDIIFTGFVQHENLPLYYSKALALLYVPYFEGFGIPIVEAQNCGCAVITSNASSMPEVVEKSALLVNPFDVDDICEKMKIIKNDNEKRVDLIKKGFENAKRFSWDKSAEKVWESIMNCVKS